MTAIETPATATDLPNAADAQALKALVPALVQACPDMYEMATAFAKRILTEHRITDLEPDQVYWHRFHGSQSNSQTFTGWEHLEHPHDSMTLTQLVIQRFTVHDQDNMDMLDNDCGFYTAGPEVGTYDQTNEVRLFGSQVLKAFWAYNFIDHYKEKVGAFWGTQSTPFRTLAKCTFLAKAMEDREAGRLSDDNFRTVVKAVASNITWPVTRQMLEAQTRPAAGLRVRRLTVGGFIATDILSIVDSQGRQIVYVPGELWGFHVLESVIDLHWWIMSEVQTPSARKRFMSHFQVADHDIMEDTATFKKSTEMLLAAIPVADLLTRFIHEPRIENVGLEHVLDLLFNAWKSNDHQLLETQDAWITDDAFTLLRDATHARMISDASFIMSSNGELRKKLWMGYLNAFGRMFGPLAAVGWPVALAVVGAGIANVGLNIDQAINGKTPMERKAGVTGAIFAAIDTLFNATFLKSGGELPDMVEADSALSTEEKISELEIERTALPLPEKLPLEPVNALEQEDFLAPFRTEITEATREGTGIAKGVIETFSGKKYIYLRWAARNGFYQVRYIGQMKCWAIIDPANPWSFYRNVPVRLNEYLEWEPVAAPGLKGGIGGKIFGFKGWGQSASPLPPVETPVTPYDVPEALRPAYSNAANGRASIRDLDEHYFDDGEYRDFKALRRRLYDDATAFFLDPPLPARPKIPSFTANVAPKVIIKGLLKDSPGILIGESHSSVASKQFLIENMPILSKQKVRTLYLEHVLTDFHQADLDVFNKTGTMSENLERYLKELDQGQITDPSGQFTFLEVVKTAQKNHIRVQAIDCMASYRSQGITGAKGNFRGRMMNYFARNVINADQAARGAHKWVALVGESHANTFEGVAGLSELEGAIGLRIEEPETGLARGIEPDPGRIADKGLLKVPVKNDLRLQLDTPPSVKQARQMDRLLTEKGMFTLQSESGTAVLFSRNRDGILLRTPIQQDSGGFFVDRPEWTSVHVRRFATLEELRNALIARRMRMVKLPAEGTAPTTNIAPADPQPSTSNTEPRPGPSRPNTAPKTPATPYDTHPLSRADMKSWVWKTEALRGTKQTHEQLLESFGPEMNLSSRRASLLIDAQTLENDQEWNNLPDRPPIPTQSRNFIEFINELFRDSPGLVIGESLDRIASTRLLIENMAEFARQGVKTLYLPRLLNDFNQAELDLFFTSKTAAMPQDLEAYLRTLSSDQPEPFTDLELVKTARQHGIRVQGTDCAASYTVTSPGFSPIETQRTKIFLTTRIMKRSQQIHGSSKWIAVTSAENTNAFRGVIGLSERTGSVGLRVEEVGLGRGRSIGLDPGIEVGRNEIDGPMYNGSSDTLYADLYLPIETPWFARSAAQRERLLFKPGFYCFERSGETFTLWHRDGNYAMTRTPIERLANGDFYITRPSWTEIDQKPFSNLLDLSHALNQRGMYPRGRTPQ